MYQTFGTKIKNRKIIVAMSGGVDSSTVAALLKDQGAEVLGVTLRLYDDNGTTKQSKTLCMNLDGAPQENRINNAMRGKKTCCAGKDIYDAQAVAEKLGIPHYVFDYRSKFYDDVIENFVDSYTRGETPIPCIQCNKTVKFGDLLKTAQDLGADALATGHYVKKITTKGGGMPQLHKSSDIDKDQSYFLFNITPEQLRYVIFPLGALHKSQTRTLAAQYNLKVSSKPDSQDICFVPGGNYRSIVKMLRPTAFKAGDIIMEDGTIVGQHSGVVNYTIGQRRGLGIAHSEPLYVVKINPERNEVVVDTRDKLRGSTLFVKELNWLGDSQLENGTKFMCNVKLRSGHVGSEAAVEYYGDGKAKIMLLEDYFGIAAGQACVMYEETRLLGGGWITKDV